MSTFKGHSWKFIANLSICGCSESVRFDRLYDYSDLKKINAFRPNP